jgi:hypothetical protein
MRGHCPSGIPKAMHMVQNNNRHIHMMEASVCNCGRTEHRLAVRELPQDASLEASDRKHRQVCRKIEKQYANSDTRCSLRKPSVRGLPA